MDTGPALLTLMEKVPVAADSSGCDEMVHVRFSGPPAPGMPAKSNDAYMPAVYAKGSRRPVRAAAWWLI